MTKEGVPPSLRTQNTHTYSLSTDSDSGTDDEGEAGTHSTHTGVGKTLAAADPEARPTQRMHGGTDPEMVAITLKTNPLKLTKKAVEMSRTTAIEA